jgi:hypothetical protein
VPQPQVQFEDGTRAKCLKGKRSREISSAKIDAIRGRDQYIQESEISLVAREVFFDPLSRIGDCGADGSEMRRDLIY